MRMLGVMVFTFLAAASMAMADGSATQFPKIAQTGAPVTFELWQWGENHAAHKKVMDLHEGMKIPQKQLPAGDLELRFRVGGVHDELTCVGYWSENPAKRGWGPEKVDPAGSTKRIYHGDDQNAADLERGGKYYFEIEAKNDGALAARRSITFEIVVPKKYFYGNDIAMTLDEPTVYARLLFPGGLKKGVTMSFDDGTQHDRRLVEIFNKYGIRGTFNLISDPLDKDGYVTRKEIKSLYAGHEVASHTVHHPPLPKQTDMVLIKEVMENRKDLESLVGYPIRGLAYPGGEGDQRVADFLPKLGIVYARLVNGTESLSLPMGNANLWICTCHHGDCLRQADRLLECKKYPAMLTVWGHSYEFENAKNWNLIEDFGKKLGHRDDIWYATNIEVFDYITAARRLVVAADGSFIQNPSATAVWVEVHGRPIELKPGAVTQVDEQASQE